ncbi:hypothetical protein [Kitasatospora sp. NPDC096140]
MRDRGGKERQGVHLRAEQLPPAFGLDGILAVATELPYEIAFATRT